tara:strand:- start:112439 stop:112624 length:186 start_codon:yes stop_codon:yes gene_type:complete
MGLFDLFLWGAGWFVAVLDVRIRKRGKSGQHRVPYFLTGRCFGRNTKITDSATENKPPLQV